MLRPDQDGEHDRGDRYHAGYRRADAVAGDGGTLVGVVRRWLVIGHAREGTGRARPRGCRDLSGTLVE